MAIGPGLGPRFKKCGLRLIRPIVAHFRPRPQNRFFVVNVPIFGMDTSTTHLLGCPNCFFFPLLKINIVWYDWDTSSIPSRDIKFELLKNPLCCRRQGPQRVVQSGSIFQWWNQHPLDIDTTIMVQILPPPHRLKSLVCCVCAPAIARLWVCLRHWVWHFDSYSKSLYRTSLFKLIVYH